MQERVGFEQTITELQGRLKEQRKAHQGAWNSVLEIVPAVDNSIVWNLFIIAELKKLINYEEELLTDLKNMLYRRADEVENLRKVMADTEKQFVDCLQQVKTLGEEREQRQKELDDLKMAAQELVEMVDPREDGTEDGPPLLDRLRGAPQKILTFVTEAATTYVGHALGLVKSFWPKSRLEVLAEGAAADCTDENFREYLLEVRPVAEKIVGDMVQDWTVST
jgi:chromosome segregation ATPase